MSLRAVAHPSSSTDDGPPSIGQGVRLRPRASSPAPSLAPPQIPALADEGQVDQVEGRVPGALLLSGKYRLDAPIAVGGMSTVWLGTHVTLGRSVAVKFIDVRSHDRDQTIERFLREARLAAAIHHPNVIDVVDFGIAENGEPVMVMELLDGETLSVRMESELRLTTAEVVHVMSQVLGALEAVHRAGILHCDMKPANVMLGTMSDANDIFAWLIDFGIAYAIDPRSELRRGRFGTDLHLVTGTPEYMAPEQAEGRTDLDERVDVYAASVMLYELLSGVCPFTDEHPGRVLYKVIDGAHVPLSVLRPDLPEIAEVVALGMSRDRDARPSSARELRRMLLHAFQVSQSVESVPDVPSGSRELRGSEAPIVVKAPPEAPTLARVDREIVRAPVSQAAIARERGVRGWLLALTCALALLAIGGTVYEAAMNGEVMVPLLARAEPAASEPMPQRAATSEATARVPAIDPPAVVAVPELPRVASTIESTLLPPDEVREEEVVIFQREEEPVRAASPRTRRARSSAPSPSEPAEEPAPRTQEPEPTVFEFAEDPGF